MPFRVYPLSKRAKSILSELSPLKVYAVSLAVVRAWHVGSPCMQSRANHTKKLTQISSKSDAFQCGILCRPL